ncbi:hypothetical protein ACWDAO_37285, partial [Streptomyces sp. NPDC001212]
AVGVQQHHRLAGPAVLLQLQDLGGLVERPGAEASGSPAARETAKSALAGLAAAERSLSDRRTAALLQAPGELARLLASVAAAGAAHAYLLTEGDK